MSFLKKNASEPGKVRKASEKAGSGNAKKKDASHYISAKEAREIARSNAKEVRALEKFRKRRNVPESEYLTQMRDENNIVEFEDLHTYFFTELGVSKAVNGVSFDVPKGKVVGIVGESGCGKSVTSMSLMQLVQAPQGQIVSGSIRFNLGDKAYDIAKMPRSAMSEIRGKQAAMIFQEPMTALNPVFTVGYQIDEVFFLRKEGISKEEAKEKTIELLNLVGIAMPERVYKSYPHELSGGMRQRVVIAIALACDPKLIIADEPTTALDVTIQAQILELLREIREKLDSSIMLITHDLGVIAQMADYVVVMYAGRVVEKGTAHDIFKDPLHPYTIGLQKSKPVVNHEVERLYSIEGSVPNPIDMPPFCYFRDRCSRACEKCAGEYPAMVKVSETHSVACYLYGEDENK